MTKTVESRRRAVAIDEAEDITGIIIPVPGGVGPMTIASLLHNTFDAEVAAR